MAALRRRAIWLILAVIVLSVLFAAAWIAPRWAPLRHALAHCTGEDDLREQIKGVGALVYLRLTQTPPRTDPFVPVRHSGLPPYGINTFLEQEADEAQVKRSLELISQAGFRFIRQEFPWEDIEISAKGDTWDYRWNKSAWDKYDRIVELAQAHGLEIVARLDNPPAWSRQVGEAPGWTMAPPDDLEDYGDFVYAVVSRYRGRVRYYQIWNEPNIYPEWGDQPADPAAYVELLKLAYRRAKEADPHCVIIAAGLAQTIEETPIEFGPRNMSDLLYLEQMYAAGAQGYFDVMGAQVYGLWTGPYDRRASRDRANFSRAQLLREIMVRHGDADKPIWATEVGWNALPDEFPAFPNYGRVTEEQQAIYAIEAYQRASREWPWMGAMNYWFFRRPSEAERDQTWYYFRMAEPDMRTLPVYGAMAWLMQQPPTVGIGYHQEDHWALHYEGRWQHLAPEGADSDARSAYALGSAGDVLRFHFSGTDLALALRDPADITKLTVLLDGRERQPMFDPAVARLGLPAAAAPDGAGAVVPLARLLRDGQHSVEIVLNEDGVAVDGLVVWRRSAAWAPVGIGLAAVALVVLGQRLWSRRRRA